MESTKHGVQRATVAYQGRHCHFVWIGRERAPVERPFHIMTNLFKAIAEATHATRYSGTHVEHL